jgi:hypothetical protein
VDVAYENVPVAGEWHHIALVFDGMKEVLYVDGEAVKEQPISLFVNNGPVVIGGSGLPLENFSGYIAGIKLFDKSLVAAGVRELMMDTAPQKYKKKKHK